MFWGYESTIGNILFGLWRKIWCIIDLLIIREINFYIDQYLWGRPDDLYWSIIMPIFSARNGHEPKLLICFQERKIRELATSEWRYELWRCGNFWRDVGWRYAWRLREFERVSKWHFLIQQSQYYRHLFGSHTIFDDLVVSFDESSLENYLRVFRMIFERLHQIDHYNMMMGLADEE